MSITSSRQQQARQEEQLTGSAAGGCVGAGALVVDIAAGSGAE